MSHKSKKRKAPKFIGPQAMPVGYRTPSDFLDFERRAARHEALQYRVGPDCKVFIQFNGIATQDAITKLISYLEMGIGEFPNSADDTATHN